MLDVSARRPGRASPTNAAQLFAAMRSGGQVGFDAVDWFNGGLFDDDDALPLERADIDELLARRPPRLGPDRSLDLRHAVRARPRPGQAQPARRPLHRPRQDHADRRAGRRRAAARRMGRGARRAIEALLGQREKAAKSASAATKRPQRARWPPHGLPRAPEALPRARPGLRLRQLPLPRAARAQGHRAPRQPRCRGAGPPARLSRRRPGSVLGIELNPYAAELARVSVWIGEIQCREIHLQAVFSLNWLG